jgi:L-aspartate oxidase
MDNTFLQRRYLIGFDSRRLGHIFTDVLVIGGGAAGLRAAIEAAETGEVIVTTKDAATESNTNYAQGGMAAATASTDSVEAHIADTLTTGCGLCDEAVVSEVLGSAREQVDQLLAWEMPFDRKSGELAMAREGGHNASRVLHADGDGTGRVLQETLLTRARATEQIKLFENCFVLDLVTDPPQGGPDAVCIGALTYHERFGLQLILARQTILACGGAGMLWRETSNPSVATADGMAMAFRAGATVADAEMMQFHPTTLYVAGSTRSLISEAVRGEGGLLIDRKGERFMPGYHEMAELAPRDVVSRAILDWMAKSGGTHVYLDVRQMPDDSFARRFPAIDAKCKQFGINPATDRIPVHPAAHYMIGGVRVDASGQTDLPGLWACGEAAATGLHGANRLASNSLTEALVLGARCGQLAGEAAAGTPVRLGPLPMHWPVNHSDRTELDLGDIRNSLQSVMWRNVGIVRCGRRLEETLEIVGFWGRYVLDKEFYDPDGWQVQNMLTAAHLISRFALRRTETRGVHYREDFPETLPDWQRHQTVRRTEEQLLID